MPRRASSIRCLFERKFHALVFEEWGGAGAAPMMCVHGLTRNGHATAFLDPPQIEAVRSFQNG